MCMYIYIYVYVLYTSLLIQRHRHCKVVIGCFYKGLFPIIFPGFGKTQLKHSKLSVTGFTTIIKAVWLL